MRSRCRGSRGGKAARRLWFHTKLWARRAIPGVTGEFHSRQPIATAPVGFCSSPTGDDNDGLVVAPIEELSDPKSNAEIPKKEEAILGVQNFPLMENCEQDGDVRGEATGSGFRRGYWPEVIPAAVAVVGAGAVVQPPEVPATVAWTVKQPAIKSTEWIDVDRLQQWLGPEYPDQGLLSMLREGCATGYEGPMVSVVVNNFNSVRGHLAEISEKIAMEVRLGRLVEATSVAGPEGEMFVSPMAMVPKPSSTKHRMIRALDQPEGASVNDGIHDLPKLILPQLDHVLRLVEAYRAAGYEEVYIRRVDVDGAYRRVPVRGCDRWQLVLEWMGQLWADAVLPMGLRSSCHLYQRLTLAIVWGLAQRGISAAGYLDDKILVGPAAVVDSWAEEVRDTLDHIGMNHSVKKWNEDGPAAAAVVVLGYDLNLEANTVTVPPPKIARLKTQLRRMRRATSMRAGDVSQVVGWMGHLVRVVPAMRPWCGGFYKQKGAFASRTDRRWCRVSAETKRCCDRWLRWLSEERGGRMFSLRGCTQKSRVIYSDASEWGGAFWCKELGGVYWEWAKVWPGYRPKHIHINVLEAIAMVTALWWWRAEVEGSAVVLRADNTAALGVMAKGHSTTSPHLQEAVYRWGEVLGAASTSAVVRVEWIASHANLYADALSRNPFGVSQVDRTAASWRQLFEEQMPVQCLDQDPALLASWWRSWTTRLRTSSSNR